MKIGKDSGNWASFWEFLPLLSDKTLTFLNTTAIVACPVLYILLN